LPRNRFAATILRRNRTAVGPKWRWRLTACGEPGLRITGLIVGDWRDGDCDGSYNA
jgi:hypothetical protein